MNQTFFCFIGYIQVSGYNPESDVRMRLGRRYLVQFDLQSAFVLMVSVPHLDMLFDQGCHTNSLELLQELFHTDDWGKHPNAPGTSTNCFFKSTAKPSDLPVTRVTVNESYAVAHARASQRGPTTATGKENANRDNSQVCGLIPLWKACGSKPPDPVLSDRNLYLILNFTVTMRVPDESDFKGCRIIFSFHQVGSFFGILSALKVTISLDSYSQV